MQFDRTNLRLVSHGNGVGGKRCFVGLKLGEVSLAAAQATGISFACFSSFLVGGHKGPSTSQRCTIFLIRIFVGLRRFAVFGKMAFTSIWVEFGSRSFRVNKVFMQPPDKPDGQIDGLGHRIELIHGLLFWGGASEGDAVNAGEADRPFHADGH